MKKQLLHAISKAINHYLSLDPESTSRAAKLSGHAVSIELLPFHYLFHLCFTDTGVTVKTDEALESETSIRGTPLQMLGVMLDKSNRQRFFAEDIVIEGNAELAQQVIKLFDELQIDWEEQMSAYIGDVPAYHVSRFLGKVGNWFGKVNSSLTQDVTDYVHDEIQLFPAAEEIQDFFTDIDNVRMDVDRVEARINLLRQHLLQEEGPQ